MIFDLSLLDGITVSIFGGILSAAFCNALQTRKTRWIFSGSMAAILLLQGGIRLLWGAEIQRMIYPITAHLPLILVLCLLTRTLLWPVFSVFTAYLCCQLRRWIALVTVSWIAGNPLMLDGVQLIVTLPLLLLLLRYITPPIQKLSHHSVRKQLQFGIIPAVYYVFDYVTGVYTDLLINGGSVVVEFMPFVCCLAYLVFLLYQSSQDQKQFQLQQAKEILSMQVSQSIREINALRESQALARQYRHDLRHHLQYLSACIENGQHRQAQGYIAGICQEIEAQKVRYYCENESVNLILSAFVSRAEKAGIDIKILGSMPAAVKVSDSDLCVLLSNALENALHACQRITAENDKHTVTVQFYQRSDKIFLQVSNPCTEHIRFENGIPVTDQPGHGIGVQSICAIVHRYGGVYTFLVRDGEFILRLSI